MRKIEIALNNHITLAKDFNLGNTTGFYVSAKESGNPFGARYEIYLHGNHIADYWYESGKIEVNINTLKRYPTVTTKSRLRALGVNVTTKNYVTYLDGNPI